MVSALNLQIGTFNVFRQVTGVAFIIEKLAEEKLKMVGRRVALVDLLPRRLSDAAANI